MRGQRRRPTILYVVHSLNPGGTERLAADMALRFSREFNILVAALDEPGRWAKALRSEHIPVYGLFREEGLDLSIPFKIARISKTEKVDLIHAHQTTPWFYSALSRYLVPRPRLLFEEHGRFFPEIRHPKKIWFNKAFISPMTHVVVAVSKDVGKRIVEYEGIAPGAVKVIYNGKAPPPDELFDPGVRLRLKNALGFKKSDFLVGSVGRFDPIKNFPMLVKAIAEARKEEEAIKGVIVGDGPAFMEIKELVDQLHLGDAIRLTGFRDDASRLMAAFDLFALTSFSEGTSMALLEAMSLGVPPVVTSVGGNPEIVEHGRSGWLVPSDDVNALKDTLLRCVRSREELTRIGEGARNVFLFRYTFDHMIDAYRKEYHDLLKMRG